MGGGGREGGSQGGRRGSREAASGQGEALGVRGPLGLGWGQVPSPRPLEGSDPGP